MLNVNSMFFKMFLGYLSEYEHYGLLLMHPVLIIRCLEIFRLLFPYYIFKI